MERSAGSVLVTPDRTTKFDLACATFKAEHEQLYRIHGGCANGRKYNINGCFPGALPRTPPSRKLPLREERIAVRIEGNSALLPKVTAISLQRNTPIGKVMELYKDLCKRRNIALLDPYFFQMDDEDQVMDGILDPVMTPETLSKRAYFDHNSGIFVMEKAEYDDGDIKKMIFNPWEYQLESLNMGFEDDVR